MKTVTLPSGEAVPALGQGTWQMAGDRGQRAEEIATIRLGLDRGLTLIDTAEMYGEGAVEELIGEAIGGRRNETFLVSKVYPHNASRAGVLAACERSLRRLKTDRIDLYLLHWPGSHPIAETVRGFQALLEAGKIRRWGVSNFDLHEMEAVWALPGGGACASDQVLYNLSRRGPEFDLMPAARARAMPIMAYSPLEQGRLTHRPALEAIARRDGATVYQVALAWTLSRPGVIAIPKAVTPAHVRENVAALDFVLTPEDLAALDHAYPPPKRKTALGML